MPIPSLKDNGELPVGVHRATIEEVLTQFGGGSLQRQNVASRLRRVFETAVATTRLSRFFVFGSFVTDKESPNDADIVMIMSDDFMLETIEGEARLLFDHAAADAHFGCSIFWVRSMAALGGEDDMIEGWQVKRDGTRRGIVEVVWE